MNTLVRLMLILASLALLPGCWSKYELTERGFVMGVALDQGDHGTIRMTTQIYRPRPSKGDTSSSTGQSNLNIETTGQTIMDAIRDIPIHLGRKAQYSHMRVIVVGEKLARSPDFVKLLDLFYRDHEPRSTVSVMIAKGEASAMLQIKPLIEQTTGQQLLRINEFSQRMSSKATNTSMLNIMLQLKGPHPDTTISYVYPDKVSSGLFSAAGVALIKGGKMTGTLSSHKVIGLNMLRNEFNSGIIDVPCAGQKELMETVEVLDLNTELKVRLNGERITVEVKTEALGAVGELKCSKLKTQADEAVFVDQMEAELNKHMLSTIQSLQAEKTDVIGIGGLIYKKHPKLWKQWKEDWDDRFAKLPFEIDVKLQLMTNGTVIGTPSLSGSP